jgi:hypothetical protein
LWDGAGTDIRVQDGVGAISLNLSDLSQPRTAARPAPVDLSGSANWPRVGTVTLPATMEAAVAS